MGLRFSISRRISMTVIALAAVLVSLWAATLISLLYSQANALQQSLTHANQSSMTAVEQQIDNFATLGRLLVISPTLASDDVAAFEVVAERATTALGNAWVVLALPDGKQIFSTRTADHRANSQLTPETVEAQQRAFATGTMQVSDVDVSRTPMITVNFPVMRDGKPRYGLAIAFSPVVFTNITAGLPEHWLAGIIDRKSKFVSRSLNNDEFVGKIAGQGWREIREQTGIFELSSLEGTHVITSTIPSPRLGWVSSVAVDKSAFYAPLWRTLGTFGLIGAAAIALCLGLVIFLGRRIETALSMLKHSVDDVLRQKSTPLRSGEHEIDIVIDAINGTASQLAEIERERSEHDRQLRMAAREVNHRSKNLLTVTIGIAALIGRDATDIKNFNARFSDRLHALGRSQNLLIDGDWEEAQFADIFRSELALFSKGNFDLIGEPISVSASAVQALCMIVHELATNAAKYGALSVPGGHVDVTWSAKPFATGQRMLSIVWRETGGPKVAAPTRRGFGTTIINASMRESLKGAVEIDYRPEGLVCSFKFPEPKRLGKVSNVLRDDIVVTAKAA